MIRYILSAIAILVIWAVVLVLQLPLWLAVAFTVLVVLGLVAFEVVQRRRATQAARNIEQALTAQADAQAQQVRPDQQEEIETMRAEFNKAVASLKSSKLARGGKDALSLLPWYLIIGPPGSGKSTALRNSGLQFPYLSARGGGVKGVGGTRNCEWWLTNEAVILDTAGRYTTEEDDRDEWVSFLDMLKRNRPKRPVNGLIVAVSVGDLIGIGEEESSQLAQRLRERVDEVTERLGLIVPIYLLFTKCDLLAGFVDIFGDLPKSERGQVWGFTVPVADPGGRSPEAQFDECFAELRNVVEQRSMHRLGEERHPETRERIFRFPQQFEGLRSNLTAFVHTLFAENVYQDTPAMRGVYFSSGTQEGSPIDRVMNAMAEAFGIRRALPLSSQPVLETRSYFLRDVFSRVIFSDQNLAVTSSAESHRRRLFQYAYAGGCLALALLILLFPMISFFKNREMLHGMRVVVEVLQAQGARADKPVEAVSALQPLRQWVELLFKYEQEGPPLSERFGLSQAEPLQKPVGDFFGMEVRRALVEPLLTQDLKEMAAFAKAYNNGELNLSARDYVRYYTLLKLHLRLSGPRLPDEPPLDEAERAWIVQTLAERWSGKPGLAESSEKQRLLGSHLELFVRLLEKEPRLAFPRNDKVIRDVRTVLEKLPYVELKLEQIVAEAGTEGHELKLSHILGGTTSYIQCPGSVPWAFTRPGYEKSVRPRLESAMQGSDAWILGRDPEATTEQELEKQAIALRSMYFNQYITEWRTFLECVVVKEPRTRTEVLAILQDLTRGEPPPLARLFQVMAFHVNLPASEEGAQDGKGGLWKDLERKIKNAPILNKGSIKKVLNQSGPGATAEESPDGIYGPEHVKAIFKPLVEFGAKAPKSPDPEAPPPESVPLDDYHEKLRFLLGAVRKDMENPEDHGPLEAAIDSARVDVRTRIESQEGGWGPLLEALLWPPVNGAKKVMLESDLKEKSQKWCSEVYIPFKRDMAGLYPVHPLSHNDAAIKDVAAFFRPGSGVCASFYNAYLRRDIVQSGVTFKPAEGSSGYSGQLLLFLQRCHELQAALFDGEAFGVEFSVRIRPTPGIATTLLTVDGKLVQYGNGPEEWHTFKWPGEGKKAGASIEVRPQGRPKESLHREGEWGLFRLLREGRVNRVPGSRQFSVTWKMPASGAEVTVDVLPSRSVTPFFGPSPKPSTPVLAPFLAPGVTPPRGVGKGGACSG
jgi:type VI secretion system protein ImpL